MHGKTLLKWHCARDVFLWDANEACEVAHMACRCVR